MSTSDVLNPLIKRLLLKEDASTSSSLSSVLDEVGDHTEPLKSASKEQSCVLNLVLWKKYGGKINLFIRDSVIEGMENQPNSNYRLVYHLLGWHELYVAAYMEAFVKLIGSKLAELSGDIDYDERLRPLLDEWLADELYPYAAKQLGKALTSTQLVHLENAATAQLALERAKSLFEMVAEYPDSLIGLKELRDCLKKSEMAGEVGQRFRATLQKRLLHMGASTTQILDFYISMIKALRILDPSDFLLNYVAAPVRKYLLTRKDAVRCIVASLTEGKESELHGELKQGGNLAYAPDEDDEEGGPGANWEPRKRIKELAEPTVKGDAASKGLDTLALLVSIYGSTNLFIVEYRTLLADKLIANTTYATDSDVANLELLKIRFGEESLHSCEVMLKDVEDSKRANNGVHSELAKLTPPPRQAGSATPTPNKAVDYAIISEHYWPTMPRDTMVYHPQAAALLDAYQRTYADLKKPRKLHPAHTLGQVELDLDFADGSTRSFTVTPLQANVILHFQEAADDASAEGSATVLSLRQLAAQCEVEEDELLTAGIAYWLGKGVLREVTDAIQAVVSPKDTYGGYGGYDEGPDRLFEVVEAQEAHAAADLSEGDGDVMHQESKLSSAAGAEQKVVLQQIEGFVKGLLSGPGNSTMSLERLHSMLRLLSGGGGAGGGAAGMSAGDLRFDMTPQQLRQFLQGLVDAGKIEYIEGVYALCQPTTSASSTSI